MHMPLETPIGEVAFGANRWPDMVDVRELMHETRARQSMRAHGTTGVRANRAPLWSARSQFASVNATLRGDEAPLISTPIASGGAVGHPDRWQSAQC
jgi:hypothetical protein